MVGFKKMFFDTVDLGGPEKSKHVSGLLENRNKKLELVLLFGLGTQGSFAMDMETRRWRYIRIDDVNLVSSAYVCTGPSILYIFGGYSQSSPLNIIFKYDHKTESLSEVYVEGEYLPPALSQSAAIQYLGDIYIYGGNTYGGSSEYSSDMYKFNLRNKIWQKVKHYGQNNQPPAGRCGHSMNIWVRSLKNKTTPFLVIYGGYVKYNELYNGPDTIMLYNISKIQF